MKRSLVLSGLVFLLTITAMIFLDRGRTTLAYDFPQTPTPFPKPSLAGQRAQQHATDQAFHVTIALTHTETLSPTFKILYSDLPPSSPVTITMQALKLPGLLCPEKKLLPSQPRFRRLHLAS